MTTTPADLRAQLAAGRAAAQVSLPMFNDDNAEDPAAVEPVDADGRPGEPESTSIFADDIGSVRRLVPIDLAERMTGCSARSLSRYAKDGLVYAVMRNGRWYVDLDGAFRKALSNKAQQRGYTAQTGGEEPGEAGGAATGEWHGEATGELLRQEDEDRRALAHARAEIAIENERLSLLERQQALRFRAEDRESEAERRDEAARHALAQVAELRKELEASERARLEERADWTTQKGELLATMFLLSLGRDQLGFLSRDSVLALLTEVKRIVAQRLGFDRSSMERLRESVLRAEARVEGVADDVVHEVLTKLASAAAS